MWEIRNMYGASFVINDNYSAAVSVTVFFLRFFNHNLFQSMPEAPCPFVQILPSDFAPVALVLNPKKIKQGTWRMLQIKN